MASLLLQQARIHQRPQPASILVEDGRIASIGEPPRGYNPTQNVDVEGRLVIPGLINGHTHLDKAFLYHTATAEAVYHKGVLESPLLEAKRRATIDEIRDRARRAITWAIQSGTTAIRTHVDIDPAHELKGVKALLQLREEFASLIDIQIVAFPQEGIVDSPETVAMVREALEMGVDLVGGKPGADEDFKAHISTMFELAREFDRDIDMHVDTDLDTDYTRNVSRHADGRWYPDDLDIVYLAELAIEHGYQGRVVASHLCALDHLPPELAANVMQLLLEARIGVIACPAVSLYLMGRTDQQDVRRGITPVRKLLNAGITTAFGTDNLGDSFNVYATPDMLTHALIAALGCHMKTVDDLDLILEMGTTNPAKLLKLRDHGLEPGCWADLVVVDADSLYDAVTRIPTRNYVFKRGVLAAMSRTVSTVFGPTHTGSL